MLYWLIPVGLLLTAAIGFWIYAGGDQELKGASGRAQIVASGITALAIVAAGALYLIERQWSPRFGIDVIAETQPVRQAGVGAALVQVVVSITNQSRTEQPIKSVEIGVGGIADLQHASPNEDGDVPARPLYNIISNKPKKVGIGETDFEYFELPVSCEWSLAKVLVKVPHPSDEKLPDGKRWLYERKLLVPLKSACEANAAGRDN